MYYVFNSALLTNKLLTNLSNWELLFKPKGSQLRDVNEKKCTGPLDNESRALTT